MRYILPIVGFGLVLCQPAFTQPPPAATPLRLTLHDAMERAERYSQQTLTANLTALMAHEDTVQAKAALLPSASGLSQFIYTQPNGTASGVFVPNDGAHIYNEYATVHGDIYAPAKRADYHLAMAAEAAARAKADLARRGLIGTVIQDYYGLVVAERKLRDAHLSLDDARRFLDITQKQERGGEVAHYDTVRAQVQFEERTRQDQEAQLAVEKARIEFAILLFPDYRQDYTVVDDLDTTPNLPPYSEIQALGGKNNPDVRAAQATVQQQSYELASARAGYLPSLSFDYFFGISANQFAIHNEEGQNLLGSVAQAQLNIPVWNWGALRSRVKQAQYKLEQARNDLSLTQRQLLADLDSFYREADLAKVQVASLKHSLDLSQQVLDLTFLRYQSGEAAVLEVVDAQTTLHDARNAYDDGLARYRLAIGNLQTLTGAF